MNSKIATKFVTNKLRYIKNRTKDKMVSVSFGNYSLHTFVIFESRECEEVSKT